MAEEAKMVPKLRFKGFSEPWRQEALSKEFKRINERNNGQFGKDRWISVANMFFQDPDKVQTNNIDTRTYVMRKGDIAFEGHPNKEFKFGRFVANDIGDGVVSELFPVYKHVRDYDSDYWKYAIHLNWIMTPIFAKSITSSGNSSNKLDAKHFLRQEIRIPSLNEQQNIGDLLKKMDAILTLHEEKLGQLKALKRGMLQKLFPAQGDVVPVLRHEGFSDNWQREKSKVLFKNISQKGHPELPVLSATQKNGMVFRDDLDMDIKYDPTSLVGYKLVSPGNFIISLRSFQGGFELSDKKGIVSPAYTVFKFNVACDHDLLYWKYFFKSYDFIESLKRVTFGIRDGKSISFTET